MRRYRRAVLTNRHFGTPHASIASSSSDADTSNESSACTRTTTTSTGSTALKLAAPDGGIANHNENTPPVAIHRRDLLGGLIHEYQRAT